MLITITGTPGTGKTVVAKELAHLLGYNLISLADLVREGKISSTYDKKRKTRIVDEEKLDDEIRKFIDANKSYVIEGGLGHYVKSSLCVVLRANPKILENRMKQREWPREKISENLKAEILDAIVIEARDINDTIIEVDTSRRSPKSTALLIKQILNNHMQKFYKVGKIDWSEKYIAYLTKDKEVE